MIAQYDGNEVFVIGTCDTHGVIQTIEPMAFGNIDSVPAPAQNALPGQVLIHNHPSGYIVPSAADISIASLYGKSGVGFYIVNNACDQVRVVVKPFFPKEMTPIEFAEIEGLFGREGHLAKTFPGFEFRAQQLAMMRVVTEAFNHDKVAIIEAGTGTGKSFAYLAPSILWALANKQRVIISTNTINLQEQLLHKDLPELARQIDREIKAVLVKGRSNYVSLRRLRFAGERPDLFHEEKSLEIQTLTEWAQNTPTGSRSDIPVKISEEVWDATMSDKDDCLRAECPFFNRCHFYHSRREAANADIIIANHHLVMADLSLKLENSGNDFVGILPSFDRIVFDEAHNLEEVATAYFTASTSQLAIRRQLFRIARPRDRAGVLQTFHTALKRHRLTPRQTSAMEALVLITDRILPVREEVENALNHYYDDLFTETLSYFHAEGMNDNERREHRITVAVTESPYWEAASRLIESILREMNRLFGYFDQLEKLLSCISAEILDDIIEPRVRLFSAVRKLSEHSAALSLFLTADKNEYCRWFEIGFRRGSPYIVPYTAPLDVSTSLREALFMKKRSVILTSATLTIDRNFRYFSRQMGLPDSRKSENDIESPSAGSGDGTLESRCQYLRLDTPFDYSKNCLLTIPRDVPLPSHQDFFRLIAPAIVECIRITQGRAMVLFTAYRPLKQVVEICRPILLLEGITCLMQGEQPRHQLMQSFKTGKKVALFATSSFWEGVDVQGDALQCLILTKLPFSVPSTPVLEARTELLERQGGNSFYELAVPQAVIRFKQGFGRLIRSKTDRGFVLILDNRVLTQRYGKIFLRSLPPARQIEGDTADILEAINSFMSVKNNND